MKLITIDFKLKRDDPTNISCNKAVEIETNGVQEWNLLYIFLIFQKRLKYWYTLHLLYSKLVRLHYFVSLAFPVD